MCVQPQDLKARALGGTGTGVAKGGVSVGAGGAGGVHRSFELKDAATIGWIARSSREGESESIVKSSARDAQQQRRARGSDSSGARRVHVARVPQRSPRVREVP